MPRRRSRSAIIVDPDGKTYPYKYLSPRQIKAAFRPFAHELGYLAVVWNQLHDNLLRIFIEVLIPTDNFAAKAIWYSTDSDFQQRKMLRALIEVDTQPLFDRPHIPRKQRLEPFQREAIFWILNQIDNPLRHQRNNALHAPLMLWPGVADGAVVHWVQATLNSQNPRAVPLQGKDLIDEFKSYAELTRVLSDYTALIANFFAVSRQISMARKTAAASSSQKENKGPQRQRATTSAPARGILDVILELRGLQRRGYGARMTFPLRRAASVSASAIFSNR
jgi:hypothetical protein